jgi:2,5-diketo-D-gluconate reductase A
MLASALLALAAPSPAVPGIVLDGDAQKPMPALGFGTCCRASAKGPPLITSTKEYLQQGGRLIDTAIMYGNHRDLAVAIRESGVPREELWVTSKINTMTSKTREATKKACEKSAAELGLQYVDLMLIHGVWTISDEQAVEVWRGLMDAKAAGTVKHIGVSNFEDSSVKRLISETSVKPAVIQLEYHPWVEGNVHELVRWCQKEGIAVTAYGSLGGSKNKARGDEIAAIATAHSATPAQVLLRWATNRGVAVIPGATSAEHIRQNLELPVLQLSEEELRRMGSTEKPAAFKRWGNLRSELGKKKGRRNKRKNR